MTELLQMAWLDKLLCQLICCKCPQSSEWAFLWQPCDSSLWLQDGTILGSKEIEIMTVHGDSRAGRASLGEERHVLANRNTSILWEL